MPDRAWSDGLHQMIEVKEGCKPSARRTTIARMTYQRFFRRYTHLSGMTGTARQVAREFWSVYRLPVVAIPTHRPVCRKALRDRVLPTEAAKWRLAVERICELHARGVPVLVGTGSVACSLAASEHLAAAGLPHLVLNAAQDSAEAAIVAQAGEPGRITVATNMAGRGTDIHLAEGVEELGGLHVIMMERHEARRIDDQLAGRSGRQGQPGCFQAILSSTTRWSTSRPAGRSGRLPGRPRLFSANGRRAGFAPCAAPGRARACRHAPRPAQVRRKAKPHPRLLRPSRVNP